MRCRAGKHTCSRVVSKSAAYGATSRLEWESPSDFVPGGPERDTPCGRDTPRVDEPYSAARSGTLRERPEVMGAVRNLFRNRNAIKEADRLR